MTDAPQDRHDDASSADDESAAESWQAFANCLGVDPDLFFPERGASTKEAKQVCQGCVVREDCLEYALANLLTQNGVVSHNADGTVDLINEAVNTALLINDDDSDDTSPPRDHTSP